MNKVQRGKFTRYYVSAFKAPDRDTFLYLTHNHRWSRDFNHAGLFSQTDLDQMKEWLLATNQSPGHAISDFTITSRKVICEIDPYSLGDIIT